MQKFAQLRELKVSGGIEDVNEALTAAQVPGDAVISVLFTPAPSPPIAKKRSVYRVIYLAE